MKLFLNLLLRMSRKLGGDVAPRDLLKCPDLPASGSSAFQRSEDEVLATHIADRESAVFLGAGQPKKTLARSI